MNTVGPAQHICIFASVVLTEHNITHYEIKVFFELVYIMS